MLNNSKSALVFFLPSLFVNLSFSFFLDYVCCFMDFVFCYLKKIPFTYSTLLFLLCFYFCISFFLSLLERVFFNILDQCLNLTWLFCSLKSEKHNSDFEHGLAIFFVLINHIFNIHFFITKVLILLSSNSV